MDMQKQPRLSAIIFVILVMAMVPISCNLPQVKQPQELVDTIHSAIRPKQPLDQRLLETLNRAQYETWIQQLSGETPVTIAGQQTYIKSRYSYAVFLNYPEAQVMPYLVEQALQWVSPDQIEIDPYTYTDAERSYTWQNLIVRLPGKSTPEKRILLTAHLDSIVVREGDALSYAPGADDNATGSAVLLEALRLLADEPFDKTVEIIFFSGEEEGYQGSQAYLQDHDPEGIEAVINVDMIGYDSNNDGCMEIHAGTNLSSQDLAGQLLLTIQQYQLALQPEVLTTDATDRSDHSSFWQQQIPAVEISENFFDNPSSGICTPSDGNPNYHRNDDTLENMNGDYAFTIAKAVILTVARLAGPQS